MLQQAILGLPETHKIENLSKDIKDTQKIQMEILEANKLNCGASIQRNCIKPQMLSSHKKTKRNLESILPGEKSQPERVTYSMIPTM